MLKIVYFERQNGEKPVLDWLNLLEKQGKSAYVKVMLAKLDKLQLEGFKLINTEMLKPIRGYSNMYEVIGGRYRILAYYDEMKDVFILLHGFMKKKQIEPLQIDIACRLVNEYVSSMRGGV